LFLNFPDTDKDSESAAQLVTIANVSEQGMIPVDVTITNITLATYFELVSTPSFPYTLGPGESLEIYVKFNPDGNAGDHSAAQGVTIASNDSGSPDYVAVSGYAYTTAIEAVSGFDKDTLLAFAFGSGPTVAVKEFDEDDLDCEEEQIVEKVHQLGDPALMKTITDFFFKYEDLGVATVVIKVWKKLKSGDVLKSQQKSVSIGTANADEKPLFADVHGFTLDGQFLGLNLFKEASSGALSLIDEYIKFVLERPVLGSDRYPTGIDSTGIVYGDLNTLLCGFATDADVVTAKKVDSANLDCEEDAYFERLTEYGADGLEKAVMETWFKYEDFGPVTMILTLTNQRDVSHANVSVAFGSASANQDIHNVVFNSIFSGELMKYKFTREAAEGPLSIVRQTTHVEPKGELHE